MIYIFAAIGGVLSAVIGFVIAAFGAMVYAYLTRMPNFEGAAGMLAVFGIGPIGGLAGLLLGIWLVLRRQTPRPRALALVSRGLAVIVGIVTPIAGVIWLIYANDDVLNRNGAAPQLTFELRLPPGTAPPNNLKSIEVELHTDKNRMPGLLFDRSTHQEGDRHVVGGQVELYFRTAQRLLVIRRKGEADRLFRVRLPAKPGHAKTMTPWQRIDFVAGPGPDDQPHPPPSGEDYDVRYRVIWAGED
jgi:hypothetical protein